MKMYRDAILVRHSALILPPLPLSYICSFPEGRWQFIQEYMLHVPFPKVFIYSCSFEYGSRCHKNAASLRGSLVDGWYQQKLGFGVLDMLGTWGVALILG